MNKRADNITDVLKIFEENGYEAYFVGGYPRDLYLGLDTIDYDITTNATPKEMIAMFDIKSESYGCCKFTYKKNKFEATTYRKDIKYADNRKPIEIEYVNDLKTDLERRDFTINTLCMDSSGNIIDLLNGKKDIDNRIIRVVGNTNKKLSEDALRILRALRFATTLNFKLDSKLIEGIKKYGYLVKNLSYDRKKSELDKIFASPNFEYGIKLIRELDLENPLEINTYNLKQTTYLVGVWAQLNTDNYKFNKSESDTIKKVRELLELDILNPKIIYKYGLYPITIAAEIKNIDIAKINQIYKTLKIKNRGEIDITPTLICDTLNMEPSSMLNMIITDLEEKIIDNNLENDENKIVKYLKETYL